jgi:large subunit ribosomal protein L32
MAEPKKRHTSTRSGNRRSHLAEKAQSLAVCTHCKEPVAPHQVCKNCGFYGEKDVLHLAEKEKAKEERRKAAEASEENNEK